MPILTFIAIISWKLYRPAKFVIVTVRNSSEIPNNEESYQHNTKLERRNKPLLWTWETELDCIQFDQSDLHQINASGSFNVTSHRANVQERSCSSYLTKQELAWDRTQCLCSQIGR